MVIENLEDQCLNEILGEIKIFVYLDGLKTYFKLFFKYLNLFE